MQRTKNHGLLYKQLCKDSCASRQGMADYLITMRKWGNEEEWEPVTRGGRERFHDYIGSTREKEAAMARGRDGEEIERLDGQIEALEEALGGAGADGANRPLGVL